MQNPPHPHSCCICHDAKIIGPNIFAPVLCYKALKSVFVAIKIFVDPGLLQDEVVASEEVTD